MKRLSTAVFAAAAVFACGEYLHALDYIYRLCLCRGEKAFLFNCNNIEKELEALEKTANKLEGIKTWAKTVPREERYICGGKLFIRIFGQQKHSCKWVIAVHGYGCTGRSMLACAMHFYQNGYNVLIPDLPCHGKSGGEVIGMGQYEYKYILACANYITKRDNYACIMLYGVSMGAAAVLTAAANTNDKHIFCAVSDCSFSSAKEIFAYQFKNVFGVPAFPVLTCLDKIWKKRSGLCLKNADISEKVKSSCVPTLFIHGGNDGIVPTCMAFKLYNAAVCPKDIVIIKQAGHGVSAYADSDTYWKKIFGFADKYYVNEA